MMKKQTGFGCYLKYLDAWHKLAKARGHNSYLQPALAYTELSPEVKAGFEDMAAKEPDRG